MQDYLFCACFCVCIRVLHINRYAVAHFSMHDIFYSKCLYVISAAQHMGKVQHQLVFLWLIRVRSSTLGTVDCIPAHINDTLSLCDDPLLGK